MKNNYSDIEEKIESAWEADYEKMPETEIENSWRDLKGRFERGNGRKKITFYNRVSGVAALIVVILTGYFFLEIYNPVIQIANDSPGNKEITLPDGSLVLLKEDSKISYRERFENVRGVELKGEAFFEVVKDSLRVFQVKTKATTTTVLGTSFNVREKLDVKNTEISLYTGKVLVSVEGKAESWAIVPGESFVLKNGEITIEEFDAELSFDAGNEFIDVNDIELVRVLKFLENRFDYQFETNSYIKKKRVTLRINKSDTLEQILGILSIINNPNYDLKKSIKKNRILKE